MDRLEHSSRLEILRAANASFGDFFLRFGGIPVAGTTEEVAALHRLEENLKAAGLVLKGCLRGQCEHEVAEEIVVYRENLVRLRQELARMQQSALQSRGRLFVRLNHLNSAKQWSAATRESG